VGGTRDRYLASFPIDAAIWERKGTGGAYGHGPGRSGYRQPHDATVTPLSDLP
jgi:hypothetical protein